MLYDDHDDLMINRFFAGDSLVAGAIQQDKADPKQNPVFFFCSLFAAAVQYWQMWRWRCVCNKGYYIAQCMTGEMKS